MNDSPSTTRVLSDMGLTPDFDALAERNPRVIAARDRGHRVHAVLEAELRGVAYTMVEHADRATNEDKTVAYEVVNWLDRYGFTEPLLFEQRLHHRTRRYHGKPDVVCRNPLTNRQAVVDLKNGTMKCAGHRLQGAAYVELWMDAAHVDAVASRLDIDVIIVYANAARIEVDRVPVADHMAAWQNFERALNLWWFRQVHGLLPSRKEVTA